MEQAKTIIIATDFSECAHNAVRYGAGIAKKLNATVLLVHIIEYPLTPHSIPANIEELADAATLEMLNLVREIKEIAGNVDTDIKIYEGEVYRGISTICEDEKPYLVIVGSQGKTTGEHLFFGEHAAYISKNLKWPVLTVPPNAVYSGLSHIGLACDFENVADSVPFNDVKNLLKDFSANLHVIYSIKDQKRNTEVLNEAFDMDQHFAPVKPEYHFEENANLMKAVTALADQHKIELLIILPKERNLLYRVLNGSTTKQLVLHSRIPILSLHN
jgi:nucleotide-binding universal stress UspA family protein